MENLNFLNLGFDNLNKIESQLVNVVAVPLTTPLEGFEQPNAFGVYRETGGAPFGVLGKDFAPQQPKQLFSSFVDCLIRNTESDLSKVRYHEMKGGAKIRFSVPVKKVSFKNMRGLNDETLITLNIQTGYDGYTATSLYLSTYRMICSNGMKANITEFKSKFKNTIHNVGKIDLLCDDVTKAINSSDSLFGAMQRMDKIEINTKRKNHFIKTVLGYSLRDKEELTIRKSNILDKVEEAIAIEFKDSGSTLWGLLNGFTRYTNHMVKDDKSLVDDYIYTAQGEKTNKLAFATAMAMAK